MNIDAYPLQWPTGVPRTPAHERQRARFSKRSTSTSQYGDRTFTSTSNKPLTLTQALQRLGGAIGGYTRTGHEWVIDPDDVVVSTNLKVRLDGLPRSGQRTPDDPGVAVYFTMHGEQRCIPCDKWDRIEDNIAGIAGALDALRSVERWVNDSHVRAAFTGFAALPAPGASEHWRDVLGLKNGAGADAVRARYRELAMTAHPDRGGSESAMVRLNRARAEALRELAQ